MGGNAAGANQRGVWDLLCTRLQTEERELDKAPQGDLFSVRLLDKANLHL